MARNPSRLAPTARLTETELPPLDPDSGRWPGHTTTVSGADVFVRVTPPTAVDAEPALCVHGLGGAATNWTDLAGQLRGHLAVEAIDLPGFGFAGPSPDNDYSLGAQARIVIEYLRQSGRGPVHLIGNSMGGAICLLVAERRPDLVRTLTVISPAVPDLRLRIHPLRHDPRMAVIVVPGVGGYALRRNAMLPVERQVKATIALCFADRTRYPAQRLAEAVEDATARRSHAWAGQAFLRATRSLVRAQIAVRSTWAAIRTISVPTLVLWGDSDKLVAPDLAGFLAAAIPDSRVLVLENIGHTAMMEDPRTTARAIMALVEDADVRAAR